MVIYLSFFFGVTLCVKVESVCLLSSLECFEINFSYDFVSFCVLMIFSILASHQQNQYENLLIYYGSVGNSVDEDIRC